MTTPAKTIEVTPKMLEQLRQLLACVYVELPGYDGTDLEKEVNAAWRKWNKVQMGLGGEKLP